MEPRHVANAARVRQPNTVPVDYAERGQEHDQQVLLSRFGAAELVGNNGELPTRWELQAVAVHCLLGQLQLHILVEKTGGTPSACPYHLKGPLRRVGERQPSRISSESSA